MGISKDMTGADVAVQRQGASGTDARHMSVGELYFRADRLKSLNGHTQTLAGFEKIRTVGKGMRIPGLFDRKYQC